MLLDFNRFFTASTLARGVDYEKHGRVLNLEVRWHSKQEVEIRGQVLGAGQEAYKTMVRVADPRGTHPRMRTQCACPVGIFCKHAVAVLMAARRQETGEENLSGQLLLAEVQQSKKFKKKKIGTSISAHIFNAQGLHGLTAKTKNTNRSHTCFQCQNLKHVP